MTKMATAKELREQANLLHGDAQKALNKVAKLREDARTLELQERQQAAAKARNDHFERMFTEIGQPLVGLNREQHGAVYALALKQGSAYGYESIEDHYGDLAELAREVLDAEERVRD